VGEVKHLNPNTSYIMKGDERYVNSGWIFPQAQSPQGLPEINSFKVTFEKAGVYNYICLVHPWIRGTVIVK
jgi:plastocyanin